MSPPSAGGKSLRRAPGLAPAARARARRIRILLFDVDGVLTDGGIVLGSDGFECKRFDVKDGMGLSLAREAGLLTGILTGRESEAVARRAAELHVDEVVQGAKDKLASLRELCRRRGLGIAEVGYVGDDLQDLEALLAAGFSAAPADARPEVRARVDAVAGARAGYGAAREIVELVLRARGAWEPLVAKYAGKGTPLPASAATGARASRRRRPG